MNRFEMGFCPTLVGVSAAENRRVAHQEIDWYRCVGLLNVIERFAMSIVGFLRDRQADILIGNQSFFSLSFQHSSTVSWTKINWTEFPFIRMEPDESSVAGSIPIARSIDQVYGPERHR